MVISNNRGITKDASDIFQFKGEGIIEDIAPIISPIINILPVRKLASSADIDGTPLIFTTSNTKDTYITFINIGSDGGASINFTSHEGIAMSFCIDPIAIGTTAHNHVDFGDRGIKLQRNSTVSGSGTGYGNVVYYEVEV